MSFRGPPSESRQLSISRYCDVSIYRLCSVHSWQLWGKCSENGERGRAVGGGVGVGGGSAQVPGARGGAQGRSSRDGGPTAGQCQSRRHLSHPVCHGDGSKAEAKRRICINHRGQYAGTVEIILERKASQWALWATTVYKLM